MKRDFKFYRTLFWSAFSLSAFTVGGGYVIIPLMHRQFVIKLKWIGEEEMLDLTAIAQSAPGPVAVNAAVLLGYRLAGFWGIVVSAFATVLPPFLILSAISFCYTYVIQNNIIRLVLRGMQAGVAAVIAGVVIQMAGQVLKEGKWVSLLLMLGAFAGVYFFNLNLILVLLGAGITGAVYFTLRKGGK